MKKQGHNRHIFLRGQSHFSWYFSQREMFFPVENSHFGKPKTNFCRFQKWKAKKKKKKKKGPHHFLYNFSYFHFQFSTFPFYNFPSFLLNFHSFYHFSLSLFSRYVIKNFPVRSLWGALCPPAPHLLRHCEKVHSNKHKIGVVLAQRLLKYLLLFWWKYFQISFRMLRLQPACYEVYDLILQNEGLYFALNLKAYSLILYRGRSLNC